MDTTTFYSNRYVTQKTAKILRLIELVCCTFCFVMAIIIFSIRLYFVTKVVLIVVATTFLFVTLVDGISWMQTRPMDPRTWTIFSVAAFHMFCLCGGFLVFLKRVTYQTLLRVTCVANFVTGYVYILDCIWIIIQYIKWLHRGDTRVVPLKEFVDRSVSTCFNMHTENEFLSRRSTPRHRSSIKTRPYVLPICSYGGTFPVSKDILPLPTPDLLREYSPRKRMYCTLVNPYPVEDGSGDHSRECYKNQSQEIRNDLSSLVFNVAQKSFAYTQQRSEISEFRNVSKVSLESSTTTQQSLKVKTQSDYCQDQAPPAHKAAQETNEAERSNKRGKTQPPEDMIVASCKQQAGGVTLTTQDCIFHQYCQQPCARCGRTHYQQQTVVNGTLCTAPMVYANMPCERESPPVQMIQVPCCPERYSYTRPQRVPCGNYSYAVIQEKQSNVKSTSSFMKKNGLQPGQYNSYVEQDNCASCGRRYRPQNFGDDGYCVKECKRETASGDLCPATGKICNKPQSVACKCCCVPETCTACTCTESQDDQRRNSAVMAVQDMTDKNVQMACATQEYNLQTSETRIITATLLNKILKSTTCDPKCTGKKSSSEFKSTDSFEDDTTEHGTSTETESHQKTVEKKSSKKASISSCQPVIIPPCMSKPSCQPGMMPPCMRKSSGQSATIPPCMTKPSRLSAGGTVDELRCEQSEEQLAVYPPGPSPLPSHGTLLKTTHPVKEPEDVVEPKELVPVHQKSPSRVMIDPVVSVAAYSGGHSSRPPSLASIGSTKHPKAMNGRSASTTTTIRSSQRGLSQLSPPQGGSVSHLDEVVHPKVPSNNSNLKEMSPIEEATLEQEADKELSMYSVVPSTQFRSRMLEVSGREVMEPIIKKEHTSLMDVEGAPQGSTCECFIAGKPSRNCKKMRQRRSEPLQESEESSDEPVNEVMYEDEGEPVEEPQFQQTRVQRDVMHVPMTESAQKAMSNRGFACAPASQSGLIGQSRSQLPQKEMSKRALAVQSEVIEETRPKMPQKFSRGTVVEPVLVSRENEEWCKMCCTAERCKQKKSRWSFFRKKKK